MPIPSKRLRWVGAQELDSGEHLRFIRDCVGNPEDATIALAIISDSLADLSNSGGRRAT